MGGQAVARLTAEGAEGTDVDVPCSSEGSTSIESCERTARHVWSAGEATIVGQVVDNVDASSGGSSAIGPLVGGQGDSVLAD